MSASRAPYLDGWVLPAGVSAPAGPPRTVPSEGSAWIRWIEPSAELLDDVADALRMGQQALARRPWREIARVVGRVAERLLDPEDDLRTGALGSLTDSSGLSREMATLVLEGMAGDWRADRLTRAVEAEPPLADALDGFTGGLPRLRARGYPLTLHIGAGTVPGVTATSVIRALLVKSAAWAKPGLGDVALTTALARGLARVDQEVAASVAVTYWPGHDTPVAVLARPDLVVAYGGADTVSSLRSGLPVTTPLVAYHHRLSFGAVAREALSAADAGRAAEAVAMAAAVFDQRGCVSPHLIFAEVGGEVDPRAWAARLAEACARVGRSLPLGRWTVGEASAVQQLRGAMEMKAAVDPSVSVATGEDLAWTVVVDPDASAESPCAGRTVRIRPVEDLARIPSLLARLAPVLQTMGFAGPGDRAAELAEVLSAVGVTRVCSFEGQPFPPPWWKHDGKSPFASLVRWTELDVG